MEFSALMKNKYVWLVAALGLALLLLPGSVGKQRAQMTAETQSARGDPLAASGIPLETESERLAALLSEVEGVGQAEVLLSREGAVVVCAGAERAEVQLAVTRVVAAYTGLGSDRIRVEKLKSLSSGGKVL